MYDFIKIMMTGAIGLLILNVSCVFFGAVTLIYAQIAGILSGEATTVVIVVMVANVICGIVIFAFLKRIWRIG